MPYKPKFFAPDEFNCTCCGKNISTDKLLKTCDTIRSYLQRPVIIVSGTRCKEYNASLKGSVPNSGHITGEAADIRVEGMTNKQLGDFIKLLDKGKLLPYLTYCYLIKGKTNTSVHIGVDAKPRKNKFAF